MSEAGPHRILVVDDHPIYRDGLTAALRRLAPACEVRHAGSVPEALAALDEGADLDLILLDLVMPGCDGLTGLGILRARLPLVPVVIISMDARDADIDRALHNGASGFIAKTADHTVLVEALRQVLNGEVVTVRGTSAPQAPVVAPGGRGDGGLTPRQRDIVHMLADGASNKEMAKRLGISPATVRVHVSDVLRALGVANRTQAAVAAERLGLAGKARS